MLRRHKERFPGAGGSAEREFNRRTHENIRANWQPWLVGVALIVGSAVYSFFVGGVAARLLAGVSGMCVGILLVMHSLGGHISAYWWRLGAEGERETAKQIEKLGPDWHCEHDVEHQYGNYDHVLVGPPGVFLLDSKFLHGVSAAAKDALRSGRVTYPGASFRAGAKTVKVGLERRLGFRGPWVQSVVVVWGDFPQRHHEEEHVVYLVGEDLVDWLMSMPERANAPQRAAYATALRELREELGSTP